MSKTVIIIGAGVSRAAASSRTLGQIPPLDFDFFQVAKTGNYLEYPSLIASLNEFFGDYSGTLVTSLETTMTYLYLKAVDSKPADKHHLAFLKMLDLLAAVLAKTTNGVKTGRRSLIYRFILSELSRLDAPEDLTVITFNYDIIVERVLEGIANTTTRKGSFFFPGCYRLDEIASINRIKNSPTFSDVSRKHEGVSVLKLHGSMNWKSTHTSDSPTPTALFNPKRKINVGYNLEIEKGLTWKRARTVYLKPIIVPPVSGKRKVMHDGIVPLWDRAAKALEQCDRVVVAGYSCPPLDIEARILLSESLRKNKDKKLYVIDPNPQTASKFVELCGVNHSTIYSSISAWVDDAR